jgi:hypothetical protein
VRVLGPGRSAALVAAATLALAGCSGARDAGGPPALRVLFLGNSLTATNDLPAAVESVAVAAGRPLEARSIAPGGVSLEEHWTSTGAREALASEAWDAVVLQQGPSSLPASKAHLRRWTRRWAAEALRHGSRPALLTVWPEAERPSALAAVIGSYAEAAAAADAELLPAGAAWRAALRERPELELYGPDGFHPSELGTYLTALVVYAGLTGTSAAKLPIDDDLPPSTGRALRRAVAHALGERR